MLISSRWSRGDGSGRICSLPSWCLPRRVSGFKAAAFKTVCVLAVVTFGTGGCQEPLFYPDQARSQYDRFDAVRDQRAPSYFYDEFGSRRPNIRGRLVSAE